MKTYLVFYLISAFSLATQYPFADSVETSAQLRDQALQKIEIEGPSQCDFQQKETETRKCKIALGLARIMIIEAHEVRKQKFVRSQTFAGVRRSGY